MISLDDFRTMKNSGQWAAPVVPAPPKVGAGIACPDCGMELETDYIPQGNDQPPRFRFKCPEDTCTVEYVI